MVPICLFTYNRLEETKKTVEALKRNSLAEKSKLYIFSDGPKTRGDIDSVHQLRQFIQEIRGFQSIEIIHSSTNLGLANSIITGVSRVLEIHNSVIVLEDDLVTSPNFLSFMNKAMKFYENDERVLSISGWSLPLKSLENYKHDIYVHKRMSSWGWGIWKNRWDTILWDKEHYMRFRFDILNYLKFRRVGADLPRMLAYFLNGSNDSWAVRACYHQAMNNLLTVAPKISMVNNIGFGETATHTSNYNRFDQNLNISSEENFTFINGIKSDFAIIKEYRKKFSTMTRLIEKLRFKYVSKTTS